MGKMISVPEEDLNVLRETFQRAGEIFASLGLNLDGKASVRIAVKKKPRQTKQQGIDKYKNLISSGVSITKPIHLKKK
jgi:hypothetical protein